MKKQVCPICNEPVVGRADKRFCSDQCRATANNKLKNTNEKQIIEVNKRLRKNRTILKTLSPVGKATVRKSILEDMGYDFSAFTSLYMPASGTLYYICYDYAFSPIVQSGVEKALIVSKQQYVSKWQPWQFVK